MVLRIAESTLQLEGQYHWNHFLSEMFFLNNKNMGMGKYEQSQCNVNITIQGKVFPKEVNML